METVIVGLQVLSLLVSISLVIHLNNKEVDQLAKDQKTFEDIQELKQNNSELQDQVSDLKGGLEFVKSRLRIKGK